MTARLAALSGLLSAGMMLLSCAGSKQSNPGDAGADAVLTAAGDAGEPDDAAADVASPDLGEEVEPGAEVAPDAPAAPDTAALPDAGVDSGEGPDLGGDASVDGQPGGPYAGCKDSESHPGTDGGGCMLRAPEQLVTYDDRTLGYSAHDVMDAINDPGVGTLTWHDGTRTKIRFEASYSGQAIQLSNFPAHQGWCWRGEIQINSAPIRMATDDGRLAETTLANIVAIDFGTPHFASAWPAWNGAFDVNKLAGTFAVPQEWIRPDNDLLSLIVVYNTRRNTCSPYCVPGEVPSDAPGNDCTAHGGKLMFVSRPQRCVVNFEYPCPEYFSATVGTWEWD